MSARLFGIAGTAGFILGPIALLWLMVHFAFGGYNPVAEGIAFAALIGPPLVCGIIYLRQMKDGRGD